MIEYREVAHGSPGYLACVQLRREVLRWPLGLEFTDEQLTGEVNDVHLGAFEEDRCLGCLILSRIDSQNVQMRQVAVASDRQRRGVGRAMVEWSEAKATALGYRRMTLHARQSAVDFYRRLGYDLIGEPFLEVGIPHREMTKALAVEEQAAENASR